ncbi:Testis-expressed sequence 10 protein [Quillaja saponaria]|uniref:Testis-expressed sequence 10 protein n=1 Tax=Quillaja saponaria TaxID=32244 RepID=A0AAD7PEZ5_QUISA|nr:Testis-expressed sequence 10 protein [Quillaja saponaria]
MKKKKKILTPVLSIPKISSLEGKNHKLIKKIRRFEGFALLEAVELEKRMVLSEWEDESPIQSFSFSMSAQDSYDNIVVNCERNETTTNQTEARELFNLFKKMTSPSNSLMVKADNLLFDFFRESVEEVEKKAKEVQVLKVAQEWFNGQPQELYLGWEVMDGRTACIKDMEKSGRWMKFDGENEQVALGLEVDVFNCLVNELIVDLLC